MKDYKAIFEKIESTLISVGSANISANSIRANLDEFKHLECKVFSDADYYWILVYVVFYAGFRAATVNAKLDLIHRYFSDYEIVAGYGDSKADEILNHWKPTIQLEEGLKKTIAYFEEELRIK